MADLLASPSNFASIVPTAKPGDRVLLAPGTYRRALNLTLMGTSAQPITIQAADAANPPVLKGSTLVTGWTRYRDSIWRVSWPYATQQVFAGGLPLQQIGPMCQYQAKTTDGHTVYEQLGVGLEDLRPGSFYFDDPNNVLYVWLPAGADPNTVEMEISQAQAVVSLYNCEHVVLRDLIVRHSSAGTYQKGGGGVVLGNHCIAERVDASLCDFAGISFGYGKTSAKAIECTVTRNGCMGLSADKHADFLMQNCTIERNNTRGFAWTWVAAGVKVTTDSWGTVEDCRIRHNLGVGVWTDFCDSGKPLVVRRNLIADNLGNGVMFEVSQNVTAEDNTIVRSDARGIYVSASWNARITNNVITGTKRLAAVDVSGTPRGGGKLVSVLVKNNLLYGNLGDRDILVRRENGTDIVGITVDGNSYSRDGQPLALTHQADSRGNWVGATYRSLAEWRAGTGFDKAEYQAG